MKKRKLVRFISMLLVVVTLVTSVSIVGFAKGNNIGTFARKPTVSPEECDCVCHGLKLPDELTDSKEGLAVLPIVLLGTGVSYGFGMFVKKIEWFFTFQWHCKCGKPHFDGLKDRS